MSDVPSDAGERAPIDVFVTRRIPLPGQAILTQAALEFEIGQTDDERGLERSLLLAGAGRCRVLLALLTERVDEEVLRFPNLIGVANMAVGFDNVEMDAATAFGVPVSNTPGVLTDTTADLTWALILAVARRLPQAHEYIEEGRFRIWGPNAFLGVDVSRGGSGHTKVLGVVGFGRIGEAVAKRALGFDMQVLAHDPRHRQRIERSRFADWAEWGELLERSDVLTLHPPLTEETRHLIGEEELRAMKSSTILINTARGPIVDEAVLVRALGAGWIAGAGLDVFEREPELAPGLAALDNVVLLPHIGSASVDTRGRMASMAATNAVAHARRERAPNIVNPAVYETAAYRKRTGQ